MRSRTISVNKILYISIIAMLVGRYLNNFSTPIYYTLLGILDLGLFGFTLLLIFKYKQPFDVYIVFLAFSFAGLFLLLYLFAYSSNITEYKNIFGVLSIISFLFSFLLCFKYVFKYGNTDAKQIAKWALVFFLISIALVLYIVYLVIFK